MALKRRFDALLGPELNRIDIAIRMSGWTMDETTASGERRFLSYSRCVPGEGGSPGIELDARRAQELHGGTSVADTDHARAAALLFEAARRLPRAYQHRAAIVLWAGGASVLACSASVGTPSRTLYTAIDRFLAEYRLTNPWAHRDEPAPADPDVCQIPGCARRDRNGRPMPHSPHGEVVEVPVVRPKRGRRAA